MSELTKKEQTDISVEMFQGMSSGFENTNQETFKTPFLKILQQLSPELKRSGPSFIADAEEGMFFNTATKQMYKEIEIIVLEISHDLLTWKPNRGGFVGIHPKAKENDIVYTRDGIQKYDKDLNEINDTISFFCMNANDPTDLFIFPLSTTSLKYAKSFSTRIRMLKINGSPAHVTFAGVWKIRTTEESNDKGSWFTIGNTPEFERFITKDELEKNIKPALELLKKAENDYSQMENVDHSSDDEEKPNF